MVLRSPCAQESVRVLARGVYVPQVMLCFTRTTPFVKPVRAFVCGAIDESTLRNHLKMRVAHHVEVRSWNTLRLLPWFGGTFCGGPSSIMLIDLPCTIKSMATPYIRIFHRNAGRAVRLTATATFFIPTLRSIGTLSVHALRDSSSLRQIWLDITPKFHFNQ